MSKKSAELIAEQLANRWSARHAPSAGTTCVVSQAVIGGQPNGRHVLDAIMGSVYNKTAAPVTVTVSIRDASIAGTVLADWDFIADSVAAAAGAACVAFAFAPQIQGIRASAMFAEFGTPNASVVQKLSIAGWTEGLN